VKKSTFTLTQKLNYQEDQKMDLDKIKEVVAEQLGVDVTELREETSLKDDLNADSLDLFQIIMSLEEEFGIEIPTEDAESICTIGDIEKYLENKNTEE
jgi:acyl carrier protein